MCLTSVKNVRYIVLWDPIKGGLYLIQIKEQGHRLLVAHQNPLSISITEEDTGLSNCTAFPRFFSPLGVAMWQSPPMSTSQWCHFQAWAIKLIVIPTSDKSMTQSNHKSRVEDGRATVSLSPWMTAWRESTPTTWSLPLSPLKPLWTVMWEGKKLLFFWAVTFRSIVSAV